MKEKLSKKYKMMLYGVAFGWMFPIIVLVLTYHWYDYQGSFIESLGPIHRDHIANVIVYLAPVVLGTLGWVIGSAWEKNQEDYDKLAGKVVAAKAISQFISESAVYMSRGVEIKLDPEIEHRKDAMGELARVVVKTNKKMTKMFYDKRDTSIELLLLLADIIAHRDTQTGDHNFRVALGTGIVARHIGVPEDKIHNILKGALLHDIGKIGISDTIFLKAGKLTEEEFEIMKTHVDIGVEITSGYKQFDEASKIIKSHHEKWDGTGYPEGLSGDRIPLESQIFAFMDVFDALISKRPYKEPMSKEDTYDFIRKNIGTHFSPVVDKAGGAFGEIIWEKVYMLTAEEVKSNFVKMLEDTYLLSTISTKNSDAANSVKVPLSATMQLRKSDVEKALEEENA